MVDLTQTSACAGLLPLRIGAIEAEERTPAALSILHPFDHETMAQQLQASHGLAWPAPNRSTVKGRARCVWFGHREVLLMGPAPNEALSNAGAVTDVTDGWAVVHLSGPGVEDVLARLVPVDLHPDRFKRGHAIRTLVGHMHASVIRVRPEAFVLMVFRPMAATLVHDLKRAMENVTARA